jgi:hypothetical protein
LDGECCITVWESWLIAADSITLSEYLLGPLFNFFFAQHRFEKTGTWPFGEWAHGQRGLVDALAESLRLPPDDLIVGRFLIETIGRDLRPRSPCPCGSTAPIQKCHKREIARIRNRLPTEKVLRVVRNIWDSRLAKEKKAEAIALVASMVRIASTEQTLRDRLLLSVSNIILFKKPWGD